MGTPIRKTRVAALLAIVAVIAGTFFRRLERRVAQLLAQHRRDGASETRRKALTAALLAVVAVIAVAAAAPTASLGAFRVHSVVTRPFSMRAPPTPRVPIPTVAAAAPTASAASVGTRMKVSGLSFSFNSRRCVPIRPNLGGGKRKVQVSWQQDGTAACEKVLFFHGPGCNGKAFGSLVRGQQRSKPLGNAFISARCITGGVLTTTPASTTTAPTSDTSAPAGDNTTPAGDNTTPAGDNTTPAGDNTTPAGDNTTPAGDNTTPAGDKTTPAGDNTTPAGDNTTPAGDNTTPAGDNTTPAGDNTTPAGDNTTPAGDNTTPAGDNTTPAGDNTTPAGDNTTPAGDNTTPAGDTTTPASTTTAPASTTTAPASITTAPASNTTAPSEYPDEESSTTGVCGYDRVNACLGGTCIDRGTERWTCVCLPNHRLSAYDCGGSRCYYCNENREAISSITVAGSDWRCKDVYTMYGLTLQQFTNMNEGIDCSALLPKGRELAVRELLQPCTAFYYIQPADTCSSVAQFLNITAKSLQLINPDVRCPTRLTAFRALCVERDPSKARPRCAKEI
ncbi:unnamed protein product [Closterium sp. Naga37s-1]|nr:unnamed protein product [Closterium sp. Naga37s-1]